MDLTPVQEVGAYLLKRDDLFEVGGVHGGKVRTCHALAVAGEGRGLVTAGARASPQVNIVAHVAKYLGMPAVGFIPSGPWGEEMRAASRAGMDLRLTSPGYNTVLRARAHVFAETEGYTAIPFGMDWQAAVTRTRPQ